MPWQPYLVAMVMHAGINVTKARGRGVNYDCLQEVMCKNNIAVKVFISVISSIKPYM